MSSPNNESDPDQNSSPAAAVSKSEESYAKMIEDMKEVVKEVVMEVVQKKMFDDHIEVVKATVKEVIEEQFAVKDHEKAVKVSNQQPTFATPPTFLTSADGSALAAAVSKLEENNAKMVENMKEVVKATVKEVIEEQFGVKDHEKAVEVGNQQDDVVKQQAKVAKQQADVVKAQAQLATGAMRRMGLFDEDMNLLAEQLKGKSAADQKIAFKIMRRKYLSTKKAEITAANERNPRNPPRRSTRQLRSAGPVTSLES